MSKGKNRLHGRERSQLLREEQKVQHDKTVADRIEKKKPFGRRKPSEGYRR